MFRQNLQTLTSHPWTPFAVVGLLVYFSLWGDEVFYGEPFLALARVEDGGIRIVTTKGADAYDSRHADGHVQFTIDLNVGRLSTDFPDAFARAGMPTGNYLQPQLKDGDLVDLICRRHRPSALVNATRVYRCDRVTTALRLGPVDETAESEVGGPAPRAP